MSGFTSDVSLDDLRALAEPRHITLVHDVGSGLLVDLTSYGLTGEPLVRDSVTAGAVTTMSGDKLIGGPQAGIIVGPRAVIELLAENPFARAMRPDKSVLAALEATLRIHRDPARALREIPTLAMLTATRDVLESKASRLAASIDNASLEPGTSTPGGGSFPNCELATTLVAVPTGQVDGLLALLRQGDPPVVARAGHGKVLLDPRTIEEDEIDDVGRVLAAACAGLA